MRKLFKFLFETKQTKKKESNAVCEKEDNRNKIY